MAKPIAIIDCAIDNPSYNCVNKLVHKHARAFTYHWVSKFGCESLDFEGEAGGYIIFGSDSNVSDRLPWQLDLAKKMKAKIEAGVPVLGICFGHQLMADAFGGSVDLVVPENLCFEGTRKQKVIKAMHGFSEGQSLEIFITHHYEVKTIPNDFIHLSTSDDCFYDGLAHKNYPYISFQGHPEASRYFVNSHIDQELSEDQITAGLVGGNQVISTFIELVDNHS